MDVGHRRPRKMRPNRLWHRDAECVWSGTVNDVTELGQGWGWGPGVGRA